MTETQDRPADYKPTQEEIDAKKRAETKIAERRRELRGTYKGMIQNSDLNKYRAHGFSAHRNTIVAWNQEKPNSEVVQAVLQMTKDDVTGLALVHAHDGGLAFVWRNAGSREYYLDVYANRKFAEIDEIIFKAASMITPGDEYPITHHLLEVPDED